MGYDGVMIGNEKNANPNRREAKDTTMVVKHGDLLAQKILDSIHALQGTMEKEVIQVFGKDSDEHRRLEDARGQLSLLFHAVNDR